MKHLLLLVLMFMGIQANAQEYKPMLTDGKMWTYAFVSPEQKHRSTCVVTVSGDTIVGGRTCKKMPYRFYYEDGKRPSRTFTRVMYEENGKVYEYGATNSPGEFSLLLDFTMNTGDGINDGFGTKVVSTDTINVQGEKRRRLTFSWKDENGVQLIWVEGIGTSLPYYCTDFPVTSAQVTRYLIECYDNGRLVFSRDDFTKGLATDGITKISAEGKTDGKVYDISGRRINTPQKGEVFIKNGEKRIAR